MGFLKYAPSAAFYLLALAAQLSGYTNGYVALALMSVATVLLLIPAYSWLHSNYHPQKPWVKRSGENPPPDQSIDKFYPASVTTKPPKLRNSLYVADIRFTFDALEADRFSEISMRVFNGSGRVVEFGGLSGQIKFNAANNTDPSKMGNLPTPTMRADSARTAVQLQETLVILSQRVPAFEADKILALLKSETTILFDLSELNIQVSAHDNPKETEQLPIWSGVSYNRGYGYSRIISASINETIGLKINIT